ncbi:alpha/beta hydrolase [Stappia sp. WLB 29]|uniref:RBBP9/YdeN family alpha/beta hydrolase n=1 Tax=Stappia sp. WLB 29 TaxID=2925220 RepID=UPI0020BD959E|nr:alpha/beta hydrolase [Stappia sp. WLB 29]
MTDGLVLPGIGGSDEAHWQSLWEAEDAGLTRFAPADWDRPELAEWTGALERALAGFSRPPLLIAHSLACLLVAHAAEKIAGRVRGAFLVAVPDPDGSAFPIEAASFRDVPARALPFPALIIASSDDPYGTPEHARRRARDWGAGLVEIGARGHINGASGLGAWREGRMLFDAFAAGARDSG